MKRFVKIAIVSIAVIFLGIQFIRIDRTNPPVVPGQSIESHTAIPGDVSEIFGRSCNDCHSYKTVYPWYSHIAPVSWFLRDHVDHGRSHLNLSEWGTYDANKQEHLLEEVCDEARGEAMPLPSYLWIHHTAVLSEADKNALCSWTESERKKTEKIFKSRQNSYNHVLPKLQSQELQPTEVLSKVRDES
ncbi:MAG TPA: heme-binding domain-containing protein [Pyrinomonadaceae bacterium]|nr:heme-binding domain-containing protein [Pyrinomonadaceae bacterium]